MNLLISLYYFLKRGIISSISLVLSSSKLQRCCYSVPLSPLGFCLFISSDYWGTTVVLSQKEPIVVRIFYSGGLDSLELTNVEDFFFACPLSCDNLVAAQWWYYLQCLSCVKSIITSNFIENWGIWKAGNISNFRRGKSVYATDVWQSILVVASQVLWQFPPCRRTCPARLTSTSRAKQIKIWWNLFPWWHCIQTYQA